MRNIGELEAYIVQESQNPYVYQSSEIPSCRYSIYEKVRSRINLSTDIRSNCNVQRNAAGELSEPGKGTNIPVLKLR